MAKIPKHVCVSFAPVKEYATRGSVITDEKHSHSVATPLNFNHGTW